MRIGGDGSRSVRERAERLLGVPRAFVATLGWRRAVALVAWLGFLAGAAYAFAAFAARVDALHDRRAWGPSWSFPSRLYVDGVVLAPGATLPRSHLIAHLDARGYRQVGHPPEEPGTWSEPRASTFEIVTRGFFDAPDPAGTGGPERVRVELRNGRLADVERRGGVEGQPSPAADTPPRLEPVLVGLAQDEHRIQRRWIPLARVPEIVREAVIATEDRRFRGHFGLDLRSNFRALLANVGAGSVREGASTITQQVARLWFLGRERTVNRKLRELFLAFGLELLLTKDEILEAYLNAVYWGQGGGAQIAGYAEAARWHLGVDPERVDLNGAALLAGIIPAPNVYAPSRDRRGARARRDGVLADLVAVRAITPAAADSVRRLPVPRHRGVPQRERFPAFTGFAREHVRPGLPEGALEHGGYSVFTTLDLVWQAEAEARLLAGVENLERWLGRGPEPLQGAFVALDPPTGAVRALVGARRASLGGFNRATQAVRQPGSAIKPFVYAAALERGGANGARFTPASTVPDLRREFETPEGPWSPRNDEGDYHAEVTLAKALAKSLNVATANVVEAVGPREIARYAERFGLTGLEPVASIGLGTHEVTLLALTSAYSAFPNGGLRPPPRPVRALVDARGRVVGPRESAPARAMTAATAAVMTGLLEDVVIFGVSYPLRARYGFTRPVGGKTGTTNDYHDAWFLGFTPDVVAGAWVGFDTPQSLRRPAAESALPLWAGIVGALLEDVPPSPFTHTRDLELVWIDPWSGGLARGDCPSPMRVPFLFGTAPAAVCRRDHASDWMRIREQRERDSVAVARRDSAAAADSLERSQ